jgi:recombination protein RecA
MSEIKELLESIDKDFGKGTLMRLGEKQSESIEVVKTGSIGLDRALGVGGLPKGRIIEIYGPESSGKTTVATHVIAEAQKQGLLCAIIDAEHAFDSPYAQALGVNVDDLYICQPDYGEQGLEVADRIISSGKFGVVVVDSVAALVPKAELEGQMGDSKMGLHARLMSQALRKITGSVSKTGTILIFINQLRDKIGVMFGSPETTTGGNALKFYASVRLDIRRSTTAVNSIMEGDVKVGNQTTVKVIKNKVAPPFTQAQFDIIYGEGIDHIGELLTYGVSSKIIEKSGSWFSYKGSKIGQGKEAVKQFLKDNPEVMNEIEKQL